MDDSSRLTVLERSGPASSEAPKHLGTAEREVEPLALLGLPGEAPGNLRVVADRYSFKLGYDLGGRQQFESRWLTVVGVTEIARQLIGSDCSEVVLAFYINVRNAIVGYVELARGTINYAFFRMRDVLRPAVLLGASYVVLAHNHPSGDVHPSEGDWDGTARLESDMEMIGIRLWDHVIVGPGPQWYAMLADKLSSTTNLCSDVVE